MDERKIITAVVIASILLIGVAGWWFLWPRQLGEIAASGTIEATEVVISSKVSGNVVKLLFTEGDIVSKGDILAQVENSQLSAVYRQALGAQNQAKANLALAQSNYNRAQELSKKGFASSQQIDEAKASLDIAAAQLEQAEAARELAALRLKDTTIISPISGYVISKAVEEGELLNPGSSVATIADLSKVTLMVYVSERQMGRIKLGGRVMVYADPYPNDRFEGKVTFISKQAEFTPKTIQTKEERVTQVFGVKIEIPNPDLKLKPGLPADAVIKL